MDFSCFMCLGIGGGFTSLKSVFLIVKYRKSNYYLLYQLELINSKKSSSGTHASKERIILYFVIFLHQQDFCEERFLFTQ